MESGAADDRSDPSVTSDLPDTENSTLAMEQESAKLQAEVQKLSKELEDLMSSRGLRNDSVKEEFGRFGAVGEEMDEDEEETGFNPREEVEKPRSEEVDEGFLRYSDLRKGRDVQSPSFARSPDLETHFPEPAKRKTPDNPRFTPTKRSITLNQVNDLLRTEGFSPLQNDGNDVSEPLLTLIKTLINTIKTLKIETGEFQEQTAYLTSELNYYKQENGKLKSQLEDSKNREEDLKFSAEQQIALLQSKLKTAQRHTPEPRAVDNSRIVTMQETIQAQMMQIEALEAQNKAMMEEVERGKRPMSGIIGQVLDLLDLKSERQVVPSLKKMLQVIRSLPGLEHFIKAVRTEVLPGSSSAVEEVLPTIRSWKFKARQWDEQSSFKLQLCKALSIDPSSSPSEIVFHIQISYLRTAAPSTDNNYFRKLFEVSASEDLMQAVNQVFLFVHEMKGLLHYCREAMGMSPNLPVQEQIDRIKRRVAGAG